LANGVTHLLISTIPPKILKVFNLLGYRGVESKGMAELNKVAFQMPYLNGLGGRLLLCIYWAYGESHGSYGAAHLDDLHYVLEKELEKYPNVKQFN
jgi:hypothetical protein